MKHSHKLVLFSALLLVLAGCSSTHRQSAAQTLDAPLARGATVLIATPADGSFNSQTATGSGARTALALRNALVRYSGDVKISRTCRDAACLDPFARTPSTYLIVPEILRWEDRRTVWSGRPDQIEIVIRVYAAKSRQLLASSTVFALSPSMMISGHKPEALLPGAINEYVTGLYQP